MIIHSANGYRIEKELRTSGDSLYRIVNNDDQDEAVRVEVTEGKARVIWYGASGSRAAFHRFQKLVDLTEQLLRDEDLA